MAGYTRQSSLDIINGLDITAPPLNAEFNQIQTAFGTTGHTHDGTPGNGPRVNLSTSVSGVLPAANGGTGAKGNIGAASAPTTGDDSADGYAIGSWWEVVGTGQMFYASGVTPGAAVWNMVLAENSSSAYLPQFTNTSDLGSLTYKFKDLYLSGGIITGSAVSVGGNLAVSGSTNFAAGINGTSASFTGDIALSGTASLNAKLADIISRLEALEA